MFLFKGWVFGISWVVFGYDVRNKMRSENLYHDYWIIWLSVKMLINKEDFGFVSGFLARWEFDFLGCKVVEMLDFNGV